MEKRKKIIKRAAAVFIAVLLLLTFFSNTIMNYALPEVSTVSVTEGSVSRNLRCQGEAETAKSADLTVSGPRVVKEVCVRNGDSVKKGQVILKYDPAENTELQEAEDQLESLKREYEKSGLKLPEDYADDETALQNAGDAVTEAEQQLDQAKKDEAAKADADQALAGAKTALDNAKSAVQALQTQADRLARDAGAADLTEYISMLQQQKAEAGNTGKDTTEISENMSAAQQLSDALADARNLQSQCEEDLTERQAAADSYTSVTTVAEAEANLKTKRQEKDSQERALNRKREQAALDSRAAGIDDAAAEQAIREQQEKVDKLKENDDSTATISPAAGVISGLSVKEGDRIEADMPFASVQSAEGEYTVRTTVSAQEARLIRTGTKAEVENIWSDDVEASVLSVGTDPADPNRNRIVTFRLKGSDISPGQTVQLSAGGETRRYDTVVPVSAVKEDSEGTFLLAVRVKGTPLGNRYTIRKVRVDVEARDTRNAAVSGDISAYENVVVNASKPVSEGQQVRLATE